VVKKGSPRETAGRTRLAKDAMLLQLALVLLRGEELTHARLKDEFLLERRSAERRLQDLRDVGLPVVSERSGREARYFLDRHRAKLNLEAIDVPPKAARALSLLVVAAQLLPSNLGVADAIERTVRASLRLRGMKASAELRRASDAVLVLENEAKDYAGKEELYLAFVDAVLEGRRVRVAYRSPRRKPEQLVIWCASVGLYKGGLYVLGVSADDDGRGAHWYALERFEGPPVADVRAGVIDHAVRVRAIETAKRRWGPATRGRGSEQVIAVKFSRAVAPYVRARPWHPSAEWSDDEDGVVMSIRLLGETVMFETWLKSWGQEARVLRPLEMAERLADDLARAAEGHLKAARAFQRALEDD
jgi:predicted DNA-binding transcriptional regulator YafY